jgi:SAM-dependent methyltransferase
MPSSNIEYVSRNLAVEASHSKAPARSAQDTAASVEFFLRTAAVIRGTDIAEDSRFLDFGCGSGGTVSQLLDRGFDALGTDIFEYWGKDRHALGANDVPPTDSVCRRLFVIDPTNNRLPFADDTFDYIVSDQVLEHVFDLAPVFAEQARVLKQGGIAIHRFPKATALVESHTKLPLTILHAFPWYLTMCARLGFRNARQRGMDWREVVASNALLFATTHYLPNSQIIRAANSPDVECYFFDSLTTSGGRAARIYRTLRRFGIGRIFRPLLSAVSLNQVLVIIKSQSK